jgi:pyruvate/2-oxoglutarate dehydrogenase complex dihydrolipoamide dehydrogenase (E3) component
MERFDAIVIGTGQSGPFLAVRLAKAGKKTAILERKRFGGTCVNNGCIPTKTLVASARAIHTARRGAEMGFSAGGEVRADFARIMARKDEIVAGFREGVEKHLRSTAGLEVILGHARFVGPHEVRVGERTLTAPWIFVNVGGRAVLPEIRGIEEVPHLDNSSMMGLDVLPAHLLVVGGSYVGLEFAQMFRRFGSRVTVIQRGDRLIPREDRDVSKAIQAFLEEDGIAVLTDANCLSAEAAGEGIRLGVSGKGDRTVEGSHLLVATGRRPNTDDLGLDAAGIVRDKAGHIRVDDELRTNVEGVWGLGDCNGRGGFTHTSYNDFEIVAENLLDGGSRRVTDRIPAYNLYVDPPLGRAGMNEEEARRSGRRVLVGRLPMSRVGRAKEMGETRGFMTVLVDADSDEILGAAILGLAGDEVIHVLLDAMYARAKASTIRKAMHIHPTVSEFLPTLLQDLKPLT